MTVGLVATTYPSDATHNYGGVDHITTGTGGAIVFGGSMGDVIKTDQNPDGTTSTSTDNTNFIFGDDGYITWVGTELNPENIGAGLNADGIFHGADTNPADIDAVVSTNPSDGGNDQITLGAGQAIVVGGQGDDTITGGTGTNIILGDSGMILAASSGAQFGTLPITVGLVQTTAPGIGGIDHITTGTGGAIVFGGTAGDVIKTDQNPDGTTSTSTDNTNFIFGDDGYITWVGTELNPENLGAGLNADGIWYGADTDSSDIDAVVSTDPSDGGNDQITLGAGKAIVVGGQGDDTITGGSGTNIILGDSGAILAASTGDQFGDAADHGRPRRDDRAAVSAASTTSRPARAASIVFGGTAGDVIKTDQNLDGTTSTSTDNTNFIFGDDGYITWVGTELNPQNLGAGLNADGIWYGADTDSSDIDAVVSTDPSDGGNDQITLGAGKAIVVGGQGDDTITGGTGTNIILGDSGAILAASSGRSVRRRCRSRSGWSRRRHRASAASTTSRRARAARSCSAAPRAT